MPLTEQQKEARKGRIGASFLPSLMQGDQPRMLEEWMRLVEHPDYVETDLSDVWAPMYGSYIEPFALDWHERKTGSALTRRGEYVPHPSEPVGCTLDAYRAFDAAVLDVKAPGSHRNLDEVLHHYTSQLVIQRACTAAERACLLVVHGGAAPREFTLSWTVEYEAEVWARVHWFWGRVETLQPPCPIPADQTPTLAVRIVDMTGDNRWGAAADCWLTTRVAAKQFEAAAKDLRSLVEPDVQEARGAGIVITRNRAGALLIKEG